MHIKNFSAVHVSPPSLDPSQKAIKAEVVGSIVLSLLEN